ncbi:MAG: D-alanine--D-alanine ligase [bacterium]|nr:D-alanine--D-alanine ligase [bacterium]
MKIVVLAGGISTERDVSLSSGTKIYHALKSLGHKTLLLDVYLGYEGDSEHIFDKEKNWAEGISSISHTAPNIPAVKALRKDGGKSFFGPNVISICQQADIVFLALHGEDGENGKLQAAFDLLGIRYTGTDYLSSALSMDKGLAKDIFALHHIPTPSGICAPIEDLKKQRPQSVPFPAVVKVCSGGSSVGVYIVRSEEDYQNALSEAEKLDNKVIVEQFIEGREFSVGVIEGKALPIIEIAPLSGFYDYKNKYQAGSTVETCPAQLSQEKSEEMQHIAEQVFAALRLKKYARMDFMMDQNGAIYCLEANTLPGMTPTSLMPQEAQAIGKSYEELCQWIVDISLKMP